MSDIAVREMLSKLSACERQALFPGVDETKLYKMSASEILAAMKVRTPADAEEKTLRWYEKPITGLSEEGKSLLKELSEETRTSDNSKTEQRQLRYLRQLEKMRMYVPTAFRSKINPKALYQQLAAFSRSHDIPEEIVQYVVPSIVEYRETGHMRPVIFVGGKGCGNTTAVRMLMREALQLYTEVIKVPQLDGSHGMTGDCATYRAADVGCIAKARLHADNLLVAYLFDEIDKTVHTGSRSNIEDQLLSITDESCSDVYDNFLETTLVGLEHCPMFMTANDLQRVSPILADRCTVISFPDADAERIKSILHKYVDQKMTGDIYKLIQIDYKRMDSHIENLAAHDVKSIRKHQQMVENALNHALNAALIQENEEIVSVTEEMFAEAEKSVLGIEKKRVGF